MGLSKCWQASRGPYRAIVFPQHLYPRLVLSTGCGLSVLRWQTRCCCFFVWFFLQIFTRTEGALNTHAHVCPGLHLHRERRARSSVTCSIQWDGLHLHLCCALPSDLRKKKRCEPWPRSVSPRETYVLYCTFADYSDFFTRQWNRTGSSRLEQ